MAKKEAQRRETESYHRQQQKNLKINQGKTA